MPNLIMSKFFDNKFIRLISIAGVAVVFSGCASPKILEKRGSVPPPAFAPSGVEADQQSDVPEIDTASQNEIPILPGQEITVSEEKFAPTKISEQKIDSFPHIEAKSIQYKVKRGDSFWLISKKFGVGMKELAAFNDMDVKDPLKAGTTINIPPGGKLVESPIVAKKAAPAVVKSGNKTNYTVKSGDSLWTISRKFGTTVGAITAANGISKNSILKTGQQLYIPKGNRTPVKSSSVKPAKTSTAVKKSTETSSNYVSPSSSRLSKEDTDLINDLIGSDNSSSSASSSQSAPQSINYLPHTVKDGDSWNTISEMYGVSVDNLKKANPKYASDSKLANGIVINIPEE